MKSSGEAELDLEDKFKEEEIEESFKDLSLAMSSDNKTSAMDESLCIKTKQAKIKSACEKTASFLSEMGFYSDVSKECSTVSVNNMQHLKKKRKKKRKQVDTTDKDFAPDLAGNEVKKQNIETAEVDEALKKYWYQRYRLFSRFDEGIKLDHGIESICFYLKNLLSSFLIFFF